MDGMKAYRNHACSAKHRTYSTFAKCAIKRTEWIAGEGEYALIAWCGVPTVMLFPDTGEAERQKAVIDSTACGHRCRRQHEIVLLVK